MSTKYLSRVLTKTQLCNEDIIEFQQKMSSAELLKVRLTQDKREFSCTFQTFQRGLMFMLFVFSFQLFITQTQRFIRGTSASYPPLTGWKIKMELLSAEELEHTNEILIRNTTFISYFFMIDDYFHGRRQCAGPSASALRTRSPAVPGSSSALTTTRICFTVAPNSVSRPPL